MPGQEIPSYGNAVVYVVCRGLDYGKHIPSCAQLSLSEQDRVCHTCLDCLACVFVSRSEDTSAPTLHPHGIGFRNGSGNGYSLGVECGGWDAILAGGFCPGVSRTISVHACCLGIIVSSASTNTI
jgi:hypothetical protein